MSIYREYDIRGIFGSELNERSVKRIGFALSEHIKGEWVAVGYDARSHSPRLFSYLVAGLNAGGKKVADLGLVPTPVSYFASFVQIDGLRASASVMITGSHNPPEYNGFKITIDEMPFFAEQIYALGRECEAMADVPEASLEVRKVDALGAYVKHLTKEFEHLRGLKKRIVYDCGNGVAGVAIRQIFENLDLDATGIYVEPDGAFPNHHPDPTDEANLKDIKELLFKHGDIAFAYDGDADRIAVLTHQNNIKGDMLALLFATKMKQNATIVGEVKCSQVMYDELKRRGHKAIMYKTGHSNLKVKMREVGADLACEVSGHLFFADRYFGYDDAIYATFRVLELLQEGLDLDSFLAKLPKLYSSEELKVSASEESKFRVVEQIRSMLKTPPEYLPTIREIIEVDGVRIIFEDGWALVRASNTTPILVTRFEASSKSVADGYRDAVDRLINEAKDIVKKR
ncbi:MAG: phosphomannomutase/phosphoglucomutase [Sulfuricurvum sp.]